MPICSGCDENVARVREYQKGRRVERLCPQCVYEREQDGEVLQPATREWTLADLEPPRRTAPRWVAAVALLLVLAMAVALYYGLY